MNIHRIEICQTTLVVEFLDDAEGKQFERVEIRNLPPMENP